MTWTPERITQLLSLAGTMTATDAAKVLGLTKGSVLGKLRRMGKTWTKDDTRKPMMDLQPQDCRYPLNGLFCAVERQNAVKPYCKVHNELCYQRERRR